MTRRLTLALVGALIALAGLFAASAGGVTDIRLWPLQTMIQADNAPPVGLGAKHEQIPHGVPSNYDWYSQPVIHQPADPSGYHYLAPWGQVYDAATGAPAPADRVELRGLQEYVLSKASGTWSPLYTHDIGYAYGHTPVTSVTGSSYQGCSPPAKVIDGIKNGLPNPYPAQCNEWASNHEGAGAWVKLAYSSPQDVRSVVLNDRPNLNDQVTAGTLSFDDGRTVSFGALDNAGANTTVPVPGGDVTQSVTMTVTGVSATTTSVGLSEMAPFATYSPQIGGALYPESYVGASICASRDYSVPGSLITTPNVDCNGNPVTGRLYHLYANTSRAYWPDPSDVAAVASVVQMRLSPTNPAGPYPDYIGNMGADEWACASGCSTVDGMGESRFKTITQDWNTFVFSTADPTTQPLPPISAAASELR
jgi:hypothetical protein